MAFLGLLAVASVACAPALPAPSAAGAKRLANRWPNVALADLERGRTLYAGRCASCHRLFDPASFSAARWEKELAEMRERAGLDQAEERSILQYLVSVAAPTSAATRFEPIRTLRPLEL